MISNALKTATEWSMVADTSAGDLFKDSFRTDGTLRQDLLARTLCIAQIVISIVSLPLSFLAMLFGSGVALCTEGREAAFALLTNAVAIPLAHLSLISKSLFNALELPLIAEKLRRDSIQDNGTWGQNLTARALFIAQAVIALVGMPLSFLAMLFMSGAVLCKGETKEACCLLKKAVATPLALLALIPTNLIAAVVPHSLKWDAPESQVSYCLMKWCLAP